MTESEKIEAEKAAKKKRLADSILNSIQADFMTLTCTRGNYWHRLLILVDPSVPETDRHTVSVTVEVVFKFERSRSYSFDNRKELCDIRVELPSSFNETARRYKVDMDTGTFNRAKVVETVKEYIERVQRNVDSKKQVADTHETLYQTVKGICDTVNPVLGVEKASDYTHSLGGVRGRNIVKVTDKTENEQLMVVTGNGVKFTIVEMASVDAQKLQKILEILAE